MKRLIPLLFVVSQFFVACENVGIVGKSQLTEPYDLKIRKVTENQSQFSIYHYDDLNVIKYEFGSSVPGNERITIYADYFYQNNRLSRVEQFVLLNEQFVKTQIEEYDYDSTNRLAAIRFQARSEFDDNWQESVQEFHYDDQNRVIKTVYLGNALPSLQTEAVQGLSEDRYFYDESGNVSKIEHYLTGAEYDGPLTTTYTYDAKKNPYYSRLEYRTGGVKLLSPNNVVGWESISPETEEACNGAGCLRIQCRGLPDQIHANGALAVDRSAAGDGSFQ